jgi:hypothetical protein
MPRLNWHIQFIIPMLGTAQEVGPDDVEWTGR